MVRICNIIFTLTFSLGFLALIIYARIFKQKPLIAFTEELTSAKYFIIFGAFIMSFLLLISILVIYYKENTEKKGKLKTIIFDKFMSYKVIQKIYEGFQYFLNTFVRAYDIVINLMSGDLQLYIVHFVRYFISYNRYFKLYIILNDLLPRIIISSIFILEIGFKELHYYFYSLTLLLIPLFFKFLVFVLKDAGPRYLPEITKFVDIETIYFNKPEKFPSHYPENCSIISVRLKPEYPHMNEEVTLNYFYYPLLDIEGVMANHFLPIYTKFRTRGLLFYYLVQTLGWGYILFTIIS